MNVLASKKCAPQTGGTQPLTFEKSKLLLRQLKGWNLDKGVLNISKGYALKNFAEAMAFINKVGDIAEAEGHHPDIHISHNNVQLVLTTRTIGGLSENDFILAAKIDSLQ